MPARIGQLKAHEVFTRDRLHHADAHQTQGTGKILGEIDDLASLDACCRLDFITRDDRSGLGSHHQHFYTKVCQFLFDQPGGELDGFRGDRLDGLRRRVKQTHSRQSTRLGGLDEKALLLFFLNTL